MIDVEAAAADRHSSSPAAPSTKPSPRTSSYRSAESAALCAETSALLASIVDPLLKFVPAHRIEWIRSVTGNCNRLSCAVRINSRHRHAGGHHITNRIAGRILASHILKSRQSLKSALPANLSG